MKKEIKSPSFKLIILSFIVSFFILSVFIFSPKVFAQEIEDSCDNTQVIEGWGILGDAVNGLAASFCDVRQTIETISNPSTILDTIVSNAVAAPFFIIFNANISQLSLCGVYYITHPITFNYDQQGGGTFVDELSSQCNLPGGQLYTTALYDKAEDYADPNHDGNLSDGGCNFNSIADFGSRARGSLWGVTELALNTATREAPPASLAYFAKHEAQKIPLISRTAFAQTTYETSWGLELVIDFWEKIKNFSLGILSAIMLIIGFLIIMRSKVNPQTMVTVQYAIPRIIISLFLIAFSYPIAAFFINAIVPLSFIAIRLLIEPQEIFNFINNIPKIIIMNILLAGTGLGMGLISTILMSTFVVLGFMISLFVASVKVIIIQAKMLVSLITAPLVFALGALPGQEDMIKNWFKQMFAKMLSIPAILFVLFLGVLMYLAPFTNLNALTRVYCASLNRASGAQVGFMIMGFSNVLSSIMLPIVSTVVIFSSIGIDKKLTEMIMGPKGKR